MIFNSLIFLIFATLFFQIYSVLSGRSRLYFLVISSLFFYGWWDWRFLGLIAFTTCVDYFMALKIQDETAASKRKLYLLISVGTNLSMLFLFKYFNFFADSLRLLMHLIGIEMDWVTLQIILPVGISFYTFQAMSYTIDVYNRDVSCERDFPTFAAFVTFFPQLVAGPIERAKRLLPQLRSLKKPTGAEIRDGIGLILVGYFLKVFIADNIARVADSYFSVPGASLSALEAGTAIMSFTIQIYGDFAGYSNIARGLAKFMGIELIVNFRQPYLATNPSDFWKRWHIALSTWFRNYVYFPLGGSRVGFTRTVRNILITMSLSGLWHGAAWVFVLWGLYHGLLVSLYHCFRRAVGESSQPNVLRVVISRVFMFLACAYGWLLFRSTSVAQIKDMTVALFTNLSLPVGKSGTNLKINLLWTLIFFCAVLYIDIVQEKKKSDTFFSFRSAHDYLMAALMLFLIVFFGGQSTSFIYFQF